MKNPVKLAKIINFAAGFVTIVAVTFFITFTLVWAAEWVGPTQSPPSGNPPGFIYNVSGLGITQQNAEIKINGPATVSSLNVSNDIAAGGSVAATADVRGNRLCIGTDCREVWPEGGTGSGESLWAAADPNNIATSNIYRSNANVGIGTQTPRSRLEVNNSGVAIGTPDNLNAAIVGITEDRNLDVNFGVVGAMNYTGGDVGGFLGGSIDYNNNKVKVGVHGWQDDSEATSFAGYFGGNVILDHGDLSLNDAIKFLENNQDSVLLAQFGGKAGFQGLQDRDLHLGLLAAPGDGSREVGLTIFGVGSLLAGMDNTENMNVWWDEQSKTYNISTHAYTNNNVSVPANVKPLKIFTDGSNQLYLDPTNGNVGVNAEGPADRLTVGGGSLSILNWPLSEMCFGGKCPDPFGANGEGTTGEYIYSARDANYPGYWSLVLGTNMQNRMIVSGNVNEGTAGNVGIGTMTPTARLTISEDSNTGGGGNSVSFKKSAVYVQGGWGCSADGCDPEGSNKYFDTNGGIVFRGDGPSWATRFTAAVGDLKFEDNGEIVGIYKREEIDGDVVTNRNNFTITNAVASFKNSGKVGIGTNDPKYKFHITGGGILSEATYSPGQDLNNHHLLGNADFMWFPESAVLRAGYWSSQQSQTIGKYSVAFGKDNLAEGYYDGVLGGVSNVASGGLAVVVNGAYNYARGVNSAVLDGQGNEVFGNYSSILSGSGNKITGGVESAIVGGAGNTINKSLGFIGGGSTNQLNADATFVLYGFGNAVNGSHSGVVGGSSNTINGTDSFILGRNIITNAGTHDIYAFGSGDGSAINASNVFVVLNSNVGIGTTNPLAKLDVNGDLNVTGNKNFIEPHPTDPNKVIRYTSLEGGESGTYTRGSGQLSNGEAVIKLPEHFSLVTSETGLTAQVTPTSDTTGLYVASKSTKQVVVRQINKGKGNATFDYLVQGVRKGYENQPVIVNKEELKNSANNKVTTTATEEVKLPEVSTPTTEELENLKPADQPKTDKTDTGNDPVVDKTESKDSNQKKTNLNWYQRIGNFFNSLFK